MPPSTSTSRCCLGVCGFFLAAFPPPCLGSLAGCTGTAGSFPAVLHPTPVKPDEQMHTPLQHVPFPLHKAPSLSTGHSGTSHATPVHPGSQWHTLLGPALLQDPCPPHVTPAAVAGHAPDAGSVQSPPVYWPLHAQVPAVTLLSPAYVLLVRAGRSAGSSGAGSLPSPDGCWQKPWPPHMSV